LKLPQAKPSVIVFEDAPAGVISGKAAGFRVVALATTHTIDQLVAAGPDWIVKDMTSVQLKAWDPTTGEAQIEISNALALANN
jgi:glycerol 3-phosphatase-1